MRRKEVDRLMLGISVGCFLIMSVSFLFMPIKALGRVPGIVFWIGLTAGVIVQIILEVRRRLFFARYRVRRQKIQKPRNGLISFGSNRYAKVVDIVMAASFVYTILAFILTRGTGYACYAFISLTVFSLCLHCILNGRIYFHVINQTKIQQVLEQNNVSTF